MNNQDWPQRLREINDALDPLASQLPELLAHVDPSQGRARDAYNMLDRLSEQAAVLLDEMDQSDASNDIIRATEALRDTIEGLRATISGKRYRTKGPIRLSR